jgi:hypothetical protein
MHALTQLCARLQLRPPLDSCIVAAQTAGITIDKKTWGNVLTLVASQGDVAGAWTVAETMASAPGEAHVSSARSLMLMGRASSRTVNHHRHHQQQEQRAIDHVNRVMEWASRVRIASSSSLRCDALQVLSSGGAAADAAHSLFDIWRKSGTKLGEKEYTAVMLAESRAGSRSLQHRATHAERAKRIERLLSCAVADGVTITTSLLNAALSSASSSNPIPLSLVVSTIPLPSPPPNAQTLDIVAAAFASTVDVNDDNSESKQVLMRIFRLEPVTFLAHTLPPPTPSTVVSVVRTCMRLNLAPLATSIMLLACNTGNDAIQNQIPLISTTACKVFADGLRRGVTYKLCGALVLYCSFVTLHPGTPPCFAMQRFLRLIVQLPR